MLASTADEREQLVDLYGAERDRIEIVPPGVDHEVFSPVGPTRAGSRRAPRSTSTTARRCCSSAGSSR